MKFNITKSLSILVLGLITFLDAGKYSEAKVVQKFVQFGRYDLTVGSEDKMCLLLGAQIKAYKRIVDSPSKLNEYQNKVDNRYDFPLRSDGALKTPPWHSVDATVHEENLTKLEQLFADFFNVGAIASTQSKISLDELFAIKINAQRQLLELLAREGIVVYQTANIVIDETGPTQVYRISMPHVFKSDKSWFIAFDDKTQLYKTRWLSFQMQNIFTYNNKGFVLVNRSYENGELAQNGLGKDISIIPVQLFLTSDQKFFHSNSNQFLDSASCVFILMRQ